VSEAHLSRLLKVDLAEELFSYHIDEKARRLAERMDGKLLLVTNTEGLAAQNVIQRYKSLADIERGFKVLKSTRTTAAHPASPCAPERRRAGGGVSTLSAEQNEVLHALGRPAAPVQIDQYRRLVRDLVQAIVRYAVPQSTRDGREMHDRIGRAANRHQDAERVLDRLRGDHLVRADGVLDQLDGRLAGQLRGNDMPSASAIQAIVLAVPITAQVPAVTERRPSTC
jgi:hypothetical protein